ncbi:glycosyltransferase family 4 protein [Luteolibacter luteus]|uniref:Glycosyltransferase family 4 protein n=1 Tax=Luteolibacter luteus TaxID=2728835 RepID=A0A858RI28_9BACT|nr:glycosyltransferase family 4 protein [Luteolibacter luteus]QJE96375.1 glycosyltransferase family 4 protein [Luteolibacter luteus]
MAFPLPPKILIAHPWMGRGGSEATAMWALHALQDLAAITFTTASPVEWDKLNATYGTSVSPEKVTLLQAPRLPGVATGTKLAFWQRAYFERFCQTLPESYDACISAYNPIRFNQPAIQLIGDFSFDEGARLELYPTASDQAHHRPSVLRRLYLSFGDQLAGRAQAGIAEPDDLVVSNSRWTAGLMATRFGIPDSPLLYPPSSSHQVEAQQPRDPLGFVCMGRIMPEKEVESIIAILDRVREAGYPATLDLAGQFGADPYSKRIARMAKDRAEWIRTPGFFGPKEKQEVFASRTYGIHGCRVEAFGIAIAEMAGAGLLPFVSAEGGVKEIVGLEELIYSDIDDAVAKIIARIQQPENLEGMRKALQERVTRFRPEFFSETLVQIVQDFLKRPLSPC